MNIYMHTKKEKWDRISCSNLPVGGPVHMNQHQSWLMRNEIEKDRFWIYSRHVHNFLK